MNTYQQSNGVRIKKSVIDSRIRKAKQIKIQEFTLMNGHVFCEDCGRNDCLPVDCSHDISVDQCQKQGRVELAWDVKNITLRGRKCHDLHDTNQIR